MTDLETDLLIANAEIKRLQAQLKETEQLLFDVTQKYETSIKMHKITTGLLNESQRRADAAVEDIKDAATTTEKVCKWCLHRGNRERCQSCGWATGLLIRDWKSDNWQWRGPVAGGDSR